MGLIKLGGYIRYGTPQTWLTLVYTPLNFHCFLASDWSSSFHAFQTNSWSDWAQIWWPNSLRVSPGLIKFWSCSTGFLLFPGLWLVKEFLCICKQIVDGIEVNFGGPTHYGPPLVWLTFDHAALNPSPDYRPLWFNTPAGDFYPLMPCYFPMWLN